jgi:hypothetical protein
LAPEPRLQLFDYCCRFGAAQLGAALDVATATRIDFVELTDEAERNLSFRMIGRRFLLLSEDVCPATRELDSRSRARCPVVRF